MGRVSEIERYLGRQMADSFDKEIKSVDEQITELTRRTAILSGARDKYRLLEKGIGPCDKCKRHVPSPCDNASNYHEYGPWDFSCREIFYPMGDA